MNLKEAKELRKCPECGSKCLVYNHERGEIFCEHCGLIITENIIDSGPEWRAFDHEQRNRRARAGAGQTYRTHDKGLGGTIVLPSSDMSPGEYELKRLQQRVHIESTSERTCIFALTEIERMASALGLPGNIREMASMLYHKVMTMQLTRKRSTEAITSALIYISCRLSGMSRTLEEICAVSRVGRREIYRAYSSLLRDLKLKVPPASPVEFVPRFCSLLGLCGKTESMAKGIIKKISETELANGKSPIGIAAAAIYIAAIYNGEPRTQKEVSEITGVTGVTIRSWYKKILDELEIDVLL